ncbi:MAG: hypothetical protein K2X49_07375 [Acetobacteraceae bacterium]|nr:hypothetical protein [Acetobacteraceae bacterium]
MSDDPAEARVAVRFLVLADASPGLLSRLLEPLARRDLIPDMVRATHDAAACSMQAEILLHAMPDGMVHLVEGNLGQVIGVRRLRTERPQRLVAAAA